MDRQGSLPPPPTYEEAQNLQIPTRTSGDDEDETSPSMPFLGPPDGSRAATDSPTRSGQIHPSSYTGPPMGTTGGETYAAGTNEPTSIPIPPGHVPIITCHSCGARQQIGQYSFLPKTQVISMHAQVGAMNYFALAPPGPGMTAPGPSITQGQRAGYPPSSGITPPPQQCNVAVHYNSNQGTVQTQPTTTQNGSETNDNSDQCCTPKCCFFMCCLLVVVVVCFLVVFSVI